MNIQFDIHPSLKRNSADIFNYEPVILKVNEFTEAAVTGFQTSFISALKSQQSVIPVLIDSYGGEAYSLLAMLDIIQGSSKPVATIVSGKAMSCGQLLASFGTKGYRYATPNSTLLMHEVSNVAYGKVGELEASVKETKKLNKGIYQKLAKYCGHNKNYFLDLMHEKKHANWYMTAKDAKTHNLIDKIGSPTFTIRADVKYELG